MGFASEAIPEDELYISYNYKMPFILPCFSFVFVEGYYRIFTSLFQTESSYSSTKSCIVQQKKSLVQVNWKMSCARQPKNREFVATKDAD